jgi:hypothetical protein
VWFTWWSLFWALVGAFGTAFMHQHTGRDTRTGGLIGLAVGGVLGPFYLVAFWVWLYYTRLNVYIYKKSRRWFEWWRP